MRFLPLALVAFVGLAACDLPPLDPDAPRVALAGNDLENLLRGKRLVMTPVEANNIDVPGVVTVLLNENSIADLQLGTSRDQMVWSVQGQGLCFSSPLAPLSTADCRTIGWVQGDRFAVFDTSETPPRKIANGAISDI